MTPRQRKAAAEALRALADVLENEEAATPPPPEPFEYVLPKDCGIPETTCRRLIKEGALPAFRLGRTLHVRRKDVLAWAEAQKVERPIRADWETPGPAKA